MKQRNKPKKEDKTIIGDEWNEEDHPTFSCSWCNRDLIRLSNRNNQSESLFCRNCQIPFEPSETQLRKKSKLGTQREEVEPAVTSIQTDPSKEIEIRHEPDLRGGFAQLAKKGTIRFTSYNTTERQDNDEYT
jgi:transcription elongation factor Elf1